MRKWLLGLMLVVCLTGGCEKSAEIKTAQELANNKIYFFYYNECPYCHEAMDYMNAKYPNLPVTMVNIYNNGGYELFEKCAQKFKLGRQVGTPLFCMGDNYLMGWSPVNQARFDEYAKPFLK